ncbi:hypothetical protein [Catellatospora paridis]|uniref:hypothetical protein n=1 Tax=Catellatospora paridis TaxID=1617086 RepID=UPI0012D40795|nr:hypothetical protein [Catellatospora paridis]
MRRRTTYATTEDRMLIALKTETLPEVRFVRRMNNANTWDTSTETVQRVYDYLTESREEFVGD